MLASRSASTAVGPNMSFDRSANGMAPGPLGARCLPSAAPASLTLSSTGLQQRSSPGLHLNVARPPPAAARLLALLAITFELPVPHPL